MPPARRGNLLADSAGPADGERFEDLAESAAFKVERIVSSSAAVPTAYDQPHDEWVVLLRGRAVLDIAGERVELAPNDWVWLPARTPHTVLETSDGALWLAVVGTGNRQPATGTRQQATGNG